MKRFLLPAELARCHRDGDYFYFCISKAKDLDATVARLTEALSGSDYRYDLSSREWRVHTRYAEVLDSLFINFPKILRSQSGATLPLESSPYNRTRHGILSGLQSRGDSPRLLSSARLSLLAWIAIGLIFIGLLPWLTEGSTPSFATLMNLPANLAIQPTATVAVFAVQAEIPAEVSAQGTSTPVPTPTPIVSQGIVFQTANLRGGPSTDFEIIAQVESGTTINVVGQIIVPDSFSWFQLDSGLWIYSQLVSGPSENVPIIEDYEGQ